MEFLPPGTLEAFGLYLVRTSALVLGAPLLGSATGFSGYKIALIVGVSFLLYTTLGTPLPDRLEPVAYAILVLREVMIGLALSFTLHTVLVAVRVGGEMIGHEMGFTMATVMDPATGVNTPIVSQMYEIFFYLGLLLVDGHHLLLRALSNSFEAAPVGFLDFDMELPMLAVQFFTQMFTAGLCFAAPVLVLLTVTSLLMALLARAVPQLNVNDLSYSARIAVGLFAMYVFAPSLAGALDGLYTNLVEGLDRTLESLGA